MSDGNAAMHHVPRAQRRDLLKRERVARKTGEWGMWETLELPFGISGTGWCRQVTEARKNRVFAVLVRPVRGGTHLAVSSLSEERPTWYEMQRIKDEIAGEDAVAIEIYPKKSEIVDGANMFHIWVCANPLPFNLWNDENANDPR